MSSTLQFYSITLDFIYKITGPIIVIAIIGLCFRYRKQISVFIAENIDRIKGKIFNQEFDIELRKKAQDTPVIDSEKEQLKKDKEQLARELEFEKIYSIIFGSQIELLRQLSSSKYLTLYQLSTFFQNIQRSYIKVFEDWSLSQFINILLSNNLIIGEADSESSDLISRYSEVRITDKGLAFLKYIDDNNYNYRDF